MGSLDDSALETIAENAENLGNLDGEAVMVENLGNLDGEALEPSPEPQ